MRSKDLTPTIVQEVDRWNHEFGGNGRILVRPSGTEPLIRVLAQAHNPALAEEACATVAELVRRELG